MISVMEYINGGVDERSVRTRPSRGTPSIRSSDNSPSSKSAVAALDERESEDAVSHPIGRRRPTRSPPPRPTRSAEFEGLKSAHRTGSRLHAPVRLNCNQADHRDRVMAALHARLPDCRIQSLSLREPVRNLFYELRAQLDSPEPDAVFLYGIEGWLPFGPEAERSPFILNLNAARNSYPKEFPFPLVFWVPQHILTTIARGAPDFCSVRSGYYSFCATPEVRDRMAERLTSASMTEVSGSSYDEKFQRFDATGGYSRRI